MIGFKTKKRVSASFIAATIPKDKPMVFWDTCSLLYIISIAQREAWGDFNTYKQILDLIENNRIVSVTSSIVYDEFKQHATDLYDISIKDEERLKNVFKEYADLLAEPDRTEIKTAARKMKLTDILADMSNRVWQNTYVINEERLYQDIAHYRVLNKISPAKEKGEYKDSYIWASFMDTSKKLGNATLRAFMTNNIEDYCIIIGKKVQGVQADIETDCNTVNAKFYYKTGDLYQQLRAELGI